MPILALSQNAKNFALLLGLGSVAGGAVSLFAHKHRLDEVFNTPHTARELAYEARKYRRRSIASSLIASSPEDDSSIHVKSTGVPAP